MSLRRSEATEAIPDVIGKIEITALPSFVFKKRLRSDGAGGGRVRSLQLCLEDAQVLVDDAPDDLQIDPEVVLHDAVSQPDDFRPLDVSELRFELLGQMICASPIISRFLTTPSWVFSSAMNPSNERSLVYRSILSMASRMSSRRSSPSA